MDAEQEQVREVMVLNTQGLHARPVMRFVDLAQSFTSDIRVETTNKKAICVDGKSAMEMMLLGATCGTALRILAKGADASRAADALAALVRERFGTEG